MGKIKASIITWLLIFLTPAMAFAADGSSRIDLTINQGPGYLLPTSPFYFADILKNNLRLVLASYNQAHKAKVHLLIAGERIAEVKVMLQEGNMPQRALDMALASMTENIEGAKTNLKDEKNSGHNVERLASDLNTTINTQKESLRILETKTDLEGALKIKASLAKVRDIEVQIEDEMAADLLQNERKKELAQAIADEQKEVLDASMKTAGLQVELAKYGPSESTTAGKNGKPTVAGAATESAKPLK